MNDQEMRELLQRIVRDIDAGRLRVRRAGRLVMVIGAPLVAATLGAGLAGCPDRSVGVPRDAAVADVRASDGAVADAGEMPDAGEDAGEDAMILPPYMAPPTIDGSIWSEPAAGRGVG